MNISKICFTGSINVPVLPKHSPGSAVCKDTYIDPNCIKQIVYNKDHQNTEINMKKGSPVKCYVTEKRSGVDYHRAIVGAYNAALLAPPGVYIDVPMSR